MARGEESTRRAASSEEPRSTPEAEEQESSGLTKVTYHGQASIRSVSKTEWEQAGVMDQEAVAWDRGNEFTVSAEELSEKAIEVLRRDSNFRFE